MGGNVMRNAYLNSKKHYSRLVLAVLTVVVGVTIYNNFLGGNVAADMKFLEHTMLFTARTNDASYEIEIAYRDITDIETREDSAFDYGQVVEGVETRLLWCGKWKNAEYGEYELYANPQIKAWIVIATTDGVFLLNNEDKRATENLANAVRKLLVSEGYWSTSEP